KPETDFAPYQEPNKLSEVFRDLGCDGSGTYPPTKSVSRKKLTRVCGSMTNSSSSDSACLSLIKMRIWFFSNASTASSNCRFQSSSRGFLSFQPLSVFSASSG